MARPLPPLPDRAPRLRPLEARLLATLKELVQQLHLFAPVENEDGISFTHNQALLDAEKLLDEVDRRH